MLEDHEFEVSGKVREIPFKNKNKNKECMDQEV
jgi:hypothetical protein